MAKAMSYQRRLMQAYVRYYLNYTPEVLEKMTLRQLAEAFNDILFVRGREKDVTVKA
ncbi:MAG: hypothetical protein LBR52_04750 [Prevotellaceae bacterium]|nr:hypothetical protein [Prevotellaceae bacterium]